MLGLSVLHNSNKINNSNTKYSKKCHIMLFNVTGELLLFVMKVSSPVLAADASGWPLLGSRSDLTHKATVLLWGLRLIPHRGGRGNVSFTFHWEPGLRRFSFLVSRRHM